MKAMAEFIEREAFLEDVEKRYCLPCQEGGKDRNGCMCRACWVDDMCGEVIGAPAADVAPVVRCKDCKHFNFEHMECENEAVSTDHEGGASYSLNFYLDDFCSYGERKE